jgi:WD40 repeat protein
VAGEPNASDKPDCGMPECFPEALKFTVDQRGTLTPERTEPIAADAREGKNGKSDAKLKLLAGLLGIDFSDLKQREKQRRLRHRIRAAAVVATLVGLICGAWQWQEGRRQADIYIENGRQELLAGNAFRALTYLSAAFAKRSQDPALRFLLAQATLGVESIEQTIGGRSDPVWFRAFSPSGDRILVSCKNNAVRLVNLLSAKDIGEFAGHESPVAFATFSDDGKMVLTVAGKTIQVWDAANRRALSTLRGHSMDVVMARFSPDGSKVVSASVDNTAKLWDRESGSLLLTLEGHTATVTSAVFNATGNRILTTSADGIGKIWDVVTGTNVSSLVGHKSSLTGGAFAPDGSQTVTFSTDDSAKVWQTNTGTLIYSLTGIQGMTNPSMAIASDGAMLLLAPTRDGGAKLWNASTGQEIGPLKDYKGGVISASLSKDGTRAVTVAQDKTVKLWNVRGRGLLASFESFDAFYSASACFSPDGRRVVVTDDKGTTQILKADSGKLVASFPETSVASTRQSARMAEWQATDIYGADRPIGRAIAFTPDGSRICFQADTALEIWSGDGSRLLHSVGPAGEKMRYFAISPDGTKAVAANRQSMRVVEVPDQQTVISFAADRNPVTAAEFSPNGAWLVTVNGIETGGEKTVMIWDLQARKLFQSLKVPNSRNAFVSASFDSTGNRLITDTPEGKQVWDVKTAAKMRTFGPETGVFLDLSPSGDRLMAFCSPEKGGAYAFGIWNVSTGRKVCHIEVAAMLSAHFDDSGQRILVAGGTGKNVQMFDADNGKLLLSFDAGPSPIAGVQLNPAGTLIATSGMADPDARIWDARTGKLLTVLNDAEMLVLHGFSRDGGRLLTTSFNGPVKLWDVKMEKRTPSEISALAVQRSPWRLDHGRLVPVSR